MKEEKAIGSRTLDTSLWVSYFIKNLFTEIIDSSEIFLLSAISLFEIKKKFLKDKLDKKEVQKIIEFVRKKSIIKDVSEEIAEKAAEISIEKELPLADSIVYTTALSNNSELLTADNDFRNLEKCRVFKNE